MLSALDEEYRQIAAVDDVTAQRACLVCDVFEIRIQLRRAPRNVDRRDGVAAKHVNDELRRLARHNLGTRRAGVHVAMPASLIAELANVDLQSLDARRTQRPLADLDELIFKRRHRDSKIAGVRCPVTQQVN